MGDAPRYAWLTKEVWAETWSRAYRYAVKLRHPPGEADDLAQSAILAALDPDRSPWRPLGAEDFASHVCKLVYSAHGNHVKSYAVLHASVGLTEAALDGQVELQTPDLVMEEKQGAELARARYDLLLERTEKDALVSLLLEADEDDDGDDDDESSTARALAKGHTLDDIEAARKRMKRHIEAVVRDLPAPDDASKGPGGKAR